MILDSGISLALIVGFGVFSLLLGVRSRMQHPGERRSMLGNKVPAVIVHHEDHAKDIYGTITHNRARGQHLLEPMKAIVKELLDLGRSVDEIGVQLGMKPEEVFRLSDFSREDFLKLMAGDHTYNKAQYIANY